MMFETLGLGKVLDEEVFDEWLEKGRKSKLGYKYLLIIWQSQDEEFLPTYIAEREELMLFDRTLGPEKLIAAYDLYSETRVE